MNDKLPDARVAEVVEYLIGTCNDLRQAMLYCEVPSEHEEELSSRIAESIFECDICNWWHSNDEGNDHNTGLVCDDCAHSHGIETEDDDVDDL